MIQELERRGMLSAVSDCTGLMGYRFAGELYEAFEVVDQALTAVLTRGFTALTHSCTTLMDRQLLERIGFFERLPSIPLEAVPHNHGTKVPAAEGAPWVLSPSTCYHTFGHLRGLRANWDLRSFSARGLCHRFEPASSDELRLGCFTMREFVLVGRHDAVEQACESAFTRAVTFLRRLSGDVFVERASDVFYGERAEVTRKVQLARGVKAEVSLPSLRSGAVAVGSRNFHRDVLTNACDIGLPPRMHSACVAFGIERVLLALLGATADYDPGHLIARVRQELAACVQPVA